MRRVSEYLGKADQAERSADESADPHFAALLRAIAQEWRDLAQHAQAMDEEEAARPVRLRGRG